MTTDVSSQASTTGPTPSDHSSGSARPSGRRDRTRRTEELIEALSGPLDEPQRRLLRDELVLLNRPVAEAVAARYRGRGVAEEDLRQAAYEGLIKSVQRFDVSLHLNLLTYAVPTIRGEIQRYFRDLGWTVRPPRRIQETQWRINRATSELSQRLGRDPARSELLATVGITQGDYDEAQAAYGAFRPASLDRRVGGDSTATLGDLLTSSENEFSGVEDREALAKALRELSDRDRRILYLRFYEDRMQREIGEELGITQMQVSRLLDRIYRQLRRLL